MAISRVLEHCSTLGRVTGDRRASARARLALELGDNLTSFLVGALATGKRHRRGLTRR